MTEIDEDRLTRVEIRLTEQESVIDDLNATITAQWRTIDGLKHQMERLAEQLEQATAAAPGGPERPPHY